jgi:signal transduction histidine kinase
MLEVLRVLAHDVKRPAVAIAGLLELLRDDLGPLAEEPAELLRLAVEEAQQTKRVGAALGWLADLERIEATGPCDLVDQAEQTIAWADGLGREVESSAGSGSVRISAAEPLVQAVVRELVLNALRHGEGDVRLRVSSGDGTGELAVHDEGTGVGSERWAICRQLLRCGGSDVAIDKALAAARPGLGAGVGLWGVERLVSRSGGTLRGSVLDAGGFVVRAAWPVV